MPNEFRALLRVGRAPPPDGQPDAPPVLELRESKGALVKDARKASGGGLRKRRQGGGTAAGAAAAGAAAAGAALPEVDHASAHGAEGESAEGWLASVGEEAGGSENDG